MSLLKKNLAAFIADEDGSELVQWAVIVAIAVVLAAIAVSISNTAGAKLEEAADFIEALPIPSPNSP